MRRSLVRDLALVAIAGAATPHVLFAVWGSVARAIRGPSDRIAGFLVPTLHRPRHGLGLLAVDAALGLVIGAALAAIIARFTRSGRLALWLAFTAAVLVSALVVPGPDGIASRLALLVRQPLVLFVLCGAWLGFWLGPRGNSTSAAR